MFHDIRLLWHKFLIKVGGEIMRIEWEVDGEFRRPLLKNHKKHIFTYEGSKERYAMWSKPTIPLQEEWGASCAYWFSPFYYTMYLVSSTPDRAVRVRALAGDIVLCSWARHSTLTVPLFTQVYKWVPANLMLGVTLRWTSIPSRGGVAIFLVA